MRRALEIRNAPQEGSERHLRFHARECRAQAEVVAEAEGEVAVVAAADVEALRVAEVGGIAVGRSEEHGDDRARLEPHPGELHRLDDGAVGELYRRLEAQALFDRAGSRERSSCSRFRS